MLLRKISENHEVFTTLATHNLDSVLVASTEMKRLEIEKSQWVHFAQINGMSDQVSGGTSQASILVTFKVSQIGLLGSFLDGIFRFEAGTLRHN